MVSIASSAAGNLPAPASARLAAELIAEHPKLYRCSACGQTVDRRQLGEVLHHEVPNHRPIPSAIR